MSRFIPKKTSKLWPYDEKVNDLPINPKFISQGNERSCVLVDKIKTHNIIIP